ncbi:MAG: VanZ family protein [Deltaproteobacteria bacterium]|nr:VanZ family protein [Deltaproteobacteria bacterium]
MALIDSHLRDPAGRRRLGIGLIVFTLTVALVVTLYPFRFTFRASMLSRIDWRLYDARHSNRDLIQNLLMLAPLGAGVALLRHGRATLSRIAAEAGLLGLGTALVIETIQIFERSRFPQAADVWRNGVGCVAGALLVGVCLRRVSGSHP